MVQPRSTVTMRRNRIVVHGPFWMKDLLKSIPGAKWDSAVRAWTYPASGIAALTLDARLPESVARDELFAQVLRDAEAESAKDAIKTATELDEVPTTARPAWHHQKQAFWFSREKAGAMLAMDMGTGKSKVALDLIQNSDDRLVLVVCPASVVDVWPLEVRRNMADPSAWTVVELRKGTVRARAGKLLDAVERADKYGAKLIAVINYEAVWRGELGAAVKSVPWSRVVADESHRIKSPNGRASKFMGELGAKVPRRLALTGTPSPHTILDVYAQYRFLDPGVYGTSYYQFKAAYARYGGYLNKQLLGFRNEDDLNQRFYSIAFRVMAEDVLDLPPEQHITRYTELEPSAARAYRSMRDEFVAFVEGGEAVTAQNVLVKLLRLSQMTSGFTPVLNELTGESVAVETSTAKAELLADTLDGLPVDEPVVVFGRFQRDLDTIHEVAAAQGRASLELSGRRKELAEWQAGDAPVLAVQIQAGGVGIDLTRAAYCIYYSIGYSLGEYEQSLARVHRPGQERPVFYYHLAVRGTVDVVIQRALAERKQVVESILGDLGSMDGEED